MAFTFTWKKNRIFFQKIAYTLCSYNHGRFATDLTPTRGSFDEYRIVGIIYYPETNDMKKIKTETYGKVVKHIIHIRGSLRLKRTTTLMDASNSFSRLRNPNYSSIRYGIEVQSEKKNTLRYVFTVHTSLFRMNVRLVMVVCILVLMFDSLSFFLRIRKEPFAFLVSKFIFDLTLNILIAWNNIFRLIKFIKKEERVAAIISTHPGCVLPSMIEHRVQTNTLFIDR